MMTVNDVFDGRGGDLANFVELDLRSLWIGVADRVRRNHAVRRHDEHRLVAAVAKVIDVFGELRRRVGRRRGGGGRRSLRKRSRANRCQQHKRAAGDGGVAHGASSLLSKTTYDAATLIPTSATPSQTCVSRVRPAG